MDELTDARVEWIARDGVAGTYQIKALAEEVLAHRAAVRIRPAVLAEARAASFDRHVDEALAVTYPAPVEAQRFDGMPHGPEGYNA